MKHVCPNCNNKFSYKQVLKSVWNWKIKCEKCSIEYKVIWYSRLIICAILYMPILMQSKLIPLIGCGIILFYIGWIIFMTPIVSIFCKYEEIK
ncbi:TIGR04104 family putative zinc finger protein [Clostridium taeniosporum]|uniref:Cxxc_20_cxxc protein n=1 Tax=Clostridium taeniosporum TaxID=394958 RepID=A0A1D7XP47_9CLOT|nr:TIGR04104 family putative zinc finger protein [Clostridium taeniosporum]AOR25103.1 hypothetical protein BGI42_15280 [Clostridium taeniosporum]